MTSDYENISFNLSSLVSKPDTETILVKSAFLVVSLVSKLLQKTAVSAAQIVLDGELIYLDTVKVLGDENNNEEEPTSLKFDITHAAQEWVENPENNLGIKIIFDNDAEALLMVSSPELVIETRHSFKTRAKRSISFSGPNVRSHTDCSAMDDLSLGRQGSTKCCR